MGHVPLFSITLVVTTRWPCRFHFLKVNETKSSHVTFTLRKDNCPAISINQTVLPQVESVKYLGLHFDCKLNWKEHIAKKRNQTDLKAKEINWLIGGNSNLSLENKLLVYKAVIKPVWTYAIELWGCASKSNVPIIQRSQPKILRTTANARRFVSNHTLHTDLNIPYVSEVINERINKHLNKPESHPNPIVQTLKQPTRNRRRWNSDLQDWGDNTGWSPYQDNIIG